MANLAKINLLIFLIIIFSIIYILRKTHIFNNLIIIEFIIITSLIIFFFIIIKIKLEFHLIFYFLILSILERILGLSILISIIRSHSNDYIKSLTIVKL